ncbi:MAG: type VI secretion system contractile sheath small subunit [Gammaproteobacteria bacterium]
MQRPERSARRKPRPTQLDAPRVQMTYDVDVGHGIEARELPFVVGVLADVAGDSEVDKRRVKERGFVAIAPDSFDEVLRAIEPRARFQVANLIDNDDSRFEVDLRFRAMEDFRPEAVAAQVEPLRKLLAARERIEALRARLLQGAVLDLP